MISGKEVQIPHRQLVNDALFSLWLDCKALCLSLLRAALQNTTVFDALAEVSYCAH